MPDDPTTSQVHLPAQFYADTAGEFRWRIVAANGRIVADSAEGYGEARDAAHGLEVAVDRGGEAIGRVVLTAQDAAAVLELVDQLPMIIRRRNVAVLADLRAKTAQALDVVEMLAGVHNIEGRVMVDDDVVDALAVYRLTRLVVGDTITKPLRERWIAAVYRRAGRLGRDPRDVGPGYWSDRVVLDGDEAPKLAVLVTCPWCSSVYVAAGVAVFRRLAPRAWRPLARFLAAAAVAGFLEGHEG